MIEVVMGKQPKVIIRWKVNMVEGGAHTYDSYAFPTTKLDR